MRTIYKNTKPLLCCLLIFSIKLLLAQEPVLVLPVGHTSSITTATYSPDGKYILTASWDNTAKIWDATEGKLISELKGHTASLISASFSPDGKYILTTSKDRTARVWRTSNAALLYQLKGHTDWVNAACFSPNGKYILTASWDNTAKLWDAATGNLIKTLKGHSGAVSAISFSADGKYILTGSKDSTVKVWQMPDGHFLKSIKGHTGWVNTAVFSKDGKYILTSSKDSTARIWQTSTGYLLHTLNGHHGVVTSATFSPDEKYIVTTSKDSTARIWETHSAHFLFELKGHTDVVNTALFSEDGKIVATSSNDHDAILWEAASGRLIKELKGHKGAVNSVTFSPDKNNILTASDDDEAIIWKIDGRILHELKGHTNVVNSAIFSPNGKYILTTSLDNTAKIWDALNGKLLSNLSGHTDWINAAVFSPDDNYIVTVSSDNTAKLWRVPDGKLLTELKGHTDWLTSAVYSPDGKYIVTTSWDNTGKIWLASDGKLIGEMKGHRGMIKAAAFSPDGKYVVTASWDSTAKIWSVSDGKLVNNLKGHTDKVRTAVYSEDGKYVLTSSWDNTAILWNAANGHLIYKLKGHKASLTSATFSSDGKYILTTSLDNTAKIWSVAEGRLLTTLEAHTNTVNSASYSPDGKYILASSDNTAKIWEASSGKLLKELKGHTASLKSAIWSPDGKYIITTSEDNTLKRWNALTGEFLYTFFAVDSTDYLAIDKDGRYDGTEAARKMLYYVCNNEIVDLEQFKDLCWEPNLVSKLVGESKEPITAKKISEVNICNYSPEVKEKNIGNGTYEYLITPKRGGVGEVQLYVNNKLVDTYQPSLLQREKGNYKLLISEEKIADYFVAGEDNEIVVKATTKSSAMQSRGTAVTISSSKKVIDPKMYVVSVGVSQYKEPKMQLNYASKDAVDFGTALSFCGKKLLNNSGSQHVFTYFFNTEAGSQRWPQKYALQKLMDSIARVAKPEDILIFFFAGHGILPGGQKNLFLLTADATSFELNGVENDVAISTDELKDWLRKIKANKQILVLDACNSGQVVDDLQQLIQKREVPSDQQRALESLKDKTGTFILSASASGQAAYETSLYGQGLLTYSLLYGIKLGGGLRENKFIDVTRWFNYASDYVRMLAKDIGGRQDPQIIGNASFDVGLVDKEAADSIKLALKKKIFSRSKFIEDEDLLNDDFDLAGLVDKELNEISERGRESPLVFVNDNNLIETYSIRGKYSVSDNTIDAKVSLFKGQKERVNQFELTGSADKKEEMARRIVEAIRVYLLQ